MSFSICGLFSNRQLRKQAALKITDDQVRVLNNLVPEVILAGNMAKRLDRNVESFAADSGLISELRWLGYKRLLEEINA